MSHGIAMSEESSDLAMRSGRAMIPFTVGAGTMVLAAHMSGISAVFPLIADQIGVSVVRGHWFLSAYTLALGGCLLVFGTLADRLGYKPIYLTGLAVYGMASGSCALASGITFLVILRSIEGIGAAMVSATSVALLGAHMPRRRLGVAVGWQTGLTCLGLTLGPTMAGLVVQRFGWRMLFLVNVPAVGLAIAAALAAPMDRPRPPDSPKTGRHPSWRLVSGFAWMAFVVALLAALGEGQISAWWCAAFCSALFILAERCSTEPLIARHLFRRAEFTRATVDETIYYFCLYATGFLMPLYLIRDRGFAAGQIGVLMASQSVARMIAAPLSGRMCDRLGTRALTRGGILFLAAAVGCMSRFGEHTAPGTIFATLVLIGAGAGLFVPANSKTLLGAAPSERYGASTAILATARNMGMTLGVAVAALLYRAFGASGTTPALNAVRSAFAVIAGIAVLHAAIRAPAPCRSERMTEFRFEDYSQQRRQLT